MQVVGVGVGVGWGWGWGWRSSRRMKQSIGKGLLGKSGFQFCGQGGIRIVRAM